MSHWLAQRQCLSQQQQRLANETFCQAVSATQICDKPMHACKLTTLETVGPRIVALDFTGQRYKGNVCVIAVTRQERLR